MRTLAIGDIHGHSEALKRLLEIVRPRPGDEIVTLGDYVDRGPDSRGVLDLLLELRREHRLVALRGNHDFMMLEARKGGEYLREWVLCGGGVTLDSYAGATGSGGLENVPAPHWKFLEEDCLDWYEIDTHFFVHANVYPDYPLEEQPTYMLHWEFCLDPAPHCSGKVMVCGHTRQQGGAPRNWGHAVCIDTWVYGEGWLTCLDVASGKVWQANRFGQTRTGWLPDP